jgi:hypothetical protein
MISNDKQEKTLQKSQIPSLPSKINRLILDVDIWDKVIQILDKTEDAKIEAKLQAAMVRVPKPKTPRL